MKTNTWCWVALACAVSWASADEWKVEDIGDWCGYMGQLAVDSKGTPHVAFPGNDDYVVYLRYGVRRNGSWKVSDVLGSLEERFIQPVSLAIDSKDRPHLVHTYLGKLTHTIRNGRAWKHTPVAPKEANPFYSRLVLDHEDRPTIAFTSNAAPVSVASSKGKGRFTVHRFTERGDYHGPGVSLHTPLALGPDGSAFLTYGRGIRLPIFERRNGEWTPSALTPPEGRSGSICVGRDGKLRVLTSYRKVWRLYTETDGAWSVEVVGSPNGVMQCSAVLALDADDRPYVAYPRRTDDGEQVRVSTRTESGWQESIVASYPRDSISGVASLELDATGRMHLLFATKTLCYATAKAPTLRPVVEGSGASEAFGERPKAQPEGPSAKPEAPSAKPSTPQPAAAPRAEAPSKVERQLTLAAELKQHPEHGRTVRKVESAVRGRVARWFKLRRAKALTCDDCDGALKTKCSACKGRQRVRCSDCRGSGSVRSSGSRRARRYTCSPCDGSGGRECKTCDEGKTACACTVANVAGFRAWALRRAFWDFVSPTVRKASPGKRDEERRESFARAVVSQTSAASECFGEELAVERFRIERIAVLPDRVLVFAEVHWVGADGPEEFRSEWHKRGRLYYLSTPLDLERDPLLD